VNPAGASGRRVLMHGRQAAGDPAERYLKALRGELHALGMVSEVVTSGSEPRLRLGSPYVGWDADSCFEGHVLRRRVRARRRRAMGAMYP
jgi:hypothetical protein